MVTGFRNIVVGYDGFERQEGIPRLALELAKEHGAQLRVVHVADEPSGRSWWFQNEVAVRLRAELLQERRESLEALLASARKGGIKASAVVRTGVPHIELIREAMSVEADLLVVSDEPIHRSGQRGFGTVTMKLMRFCPCPVLAKRDPRKYKHRAILASVDLEQSVLDEPELNSQILATAGGLIRRAGGKLVVFHAWALPGEHLLQARGHMQPEEVQRLIEETRQARKSEGERLLRDPALKDLDVTLKLVKGDPRRVLPNFVEQNKIDLIVMGTVSRTGLQGLVMGNTAERILNELTSSVVAVKPKGFVSPVEPDLD